ncbi:GDNF family receptor alpha-1-like protein [Cricetulus griseus]|nr:GDNF family receptor alpha-1-like protein [Cricetulus griseus]
MVPVSDQPLFSAKVEPQPTHSNSSPKLICVMWRRVLIPIELPLGSAEDADVAQKAIRNAHKIVGRSLGAVNFLVTGSWKVCVYLGSVCYMSGTEAVSPPFCM